jgi:hypothetical protein
MAVRLTPDDEHFRRDVVGLEGNLEAIARIYHVTPSAISHRLWSEKHSEWWSTYKRRRSRRRRAARQQRYRDRCRQRVVGPGPRAGGVPVAPDEPGWAQELLEHLLRLHADHASADADHPDEHTRDDGP